MNGDFYIGSITVRRGRDADGAQRRLGRGCGRSFRASTGRATSVIYWATRRWGWKLVGLFFDRSLFDRFSWLKSAKRLELIMLVVFLIPGTPKDFLTYFAGLTNMRFLPVVLIATFGRIPSIVTSTITASAVGAGNWTLVACTLVASALLLLSLMHI